MYGVKSWPQLKNFNRGTYTGDYTGVQTAGKSSKIKAFEWCRSKWLYVSSKRLHSVTVVLGRASSGM